RDQLAQILKEVTETRNGESTAVNEANKQKIIESGGTVRTLDAAQRKAWVDALKPVWAKFEGDIGKDLIEAAQSYNKGS
ncbi:MAG: C4-dicarboxylate ABC transporter, partial [Pseudomonadota bacterium]